MSSNYTDSSTADQMSQLAPDQGGPMDVDAARRVEDSKLTRRAALRKLGYGAGIAAFSLLGVDDFARMVGQRLQRQAGDSQVAQAVAHEFQQAGIVLANPVGMAATSGSHCISDYDCTGCGGSAVTGDCCHGSSDPTTCCTKSYGGMNGNVAACQQCCDHAWPGVSGFHTSCYNACGGIV